MTVTSEIVSFMHGTSWSLTRAYTIGLVVTMDFELPVIGVIPLPWEPLVYYF